MTCCQCDIALKNVVSLSWELNCALKFVVKSLQNKSGVFYSFLRGCIVVDVSVTCCQCDIALINVVSISLKLNGAQKFIKKTLPYESGVFWSFSNL